MTNEQAIEKLEKQRKLLGKFKDKPTPSIEFSGWARDTSLIIQHTFCSEPSNQELETEKQVREFYNIKFSPSRSSRSSYSPEYLRRFFLKGLEEMDVFLGSLIKEVQDFRIDQPENNKIQIKQVGINQPQITKTEPVEEIAEICVRFHQVASQLKKRHDQRPTLEVNDEYDVQDLLHALLRLRFDDVREEEWTPSFAGASSRCDFLLKQERILLEIKKTRDKLAAREVGEQLLIDIAKYKNHPDCGQLICFVYDPEGRIANPRGLENDLNKTHDDLQVKVIVAPR